MIDINDIDPDWTSDELIKKMIADADEEDLILYLSGLDGEAIDRITMRKEIVKYLEQIKPYLGMVINGIGEDIDKSGITIIPSQIKLMDQVKNKSVFRRVGAVGKNGRAKI